MNTGAPLAPTGDRFISSPWQARGLHCYLGPCQSKPERRPEGTIAGPKLCASAAMASRMKENRRIPVSHKVIEKRRRDRINRCLLELGRAVPMALAKQSSGKLEKAEILEMTVQYLRALHSAEFPRGRDKELLSEFANYFHYGYHECMKNLVHYLTTVERMETKDTKYARILAFLQSKARFGTEPLFSALPEPELACQLLPVADYPRPSEASFQHGATAHYSWHGAARSPAAPTYIPSPPLSLPCSPGQQHGNFLSSVQCQGLDRRYLNLMGPSHPSTFSLHSSQHHAVL